MISESTKEARASRGKLLKVRRFRKEVSEAFVKRSVTNSTTRKAVRRSTRTGTKTIPVRIIAAVFSTASVDQYGFLLGVIVPPRC